MAGPDRDALLDAALDVLLDHALEPIVELVAFHDGEAYEARAVDGRVRFARDGDGYRELTVEGRNPLCDQSTDRFAPLADELANRQPDRAVNAYPHGYEQVAQLYDSPHAPDVVVFHTAAHHWADQGGHLGEHGSIGVVQARAPFVLAGRGVRPLGMLERSCRLVDVAPTVCALMGTAPLDPAAGRFLGRQDGVALLDLLDPAERPDHVVGFLLDGTNANVLYDAVAGGECPNIARLLAMGTAFRHGAMSSLPTVTLANHTTVMTGAHPGHHGIVHNAWWDRAEGVQRISNDPNGWLVAMDWLTPGTETVHHAVRRTWPGAFTAAVNEPAGAGASWSTFDLMKRGLDVRFPKGYEHPHTTERFVRPVKEYGFYTRVDHHAVEQAVGIIEGSYLGESFPMPRYLWVNFTLTDAAFHHGGPHSEIARSSLHDTDGRVGAVLAALERAGVFDRSAFYVVADHGMEESDPGVTGDWDAALAAAGIPFRDEAYGFVYLAP
jgi:phosphonoacetate hydrolase